MNLETAKNESESTLDRLRRALEKIMPNFENQDQGRLIDKLREALKKIIPNFENQDQGRLIVVTCGSYARKEATSGSDLDFFIIFSSPKYKKKRLQETISTKIAKVIEEEGIKLPSNNGAFGQFIEKEELLKNIGGDKDNNQHITRRILYLLEGKSLYNEGDFLSLRKEIIKKYIKGTKKEHLPRYLLNDIIRYWRTVTVDYAFKADRYKEGGWAIRNIKLIYSRKILYASGIFSVAYTIGLPEDEKISKLADLLCKTPLERIEYVCDAHAKEYNKYKVKEYLIEIKRQYKTFLEKIDDKSIRECLEKLPQEKRDDETTFTEFKKEGTTFGKSLYELFLSTFPEDHEIREAVIF
ncbi:nucleotidyltransferase domain-containing protein [Bombella apis]|uniref:Nucleotidyltransferase domain-containing protein n=1 Tax=Bombella apis TaxID=1785988 RepID=A0ABR9MQZ6_9PROT|nr:nucleotidyltransferase domain-containing protein [Bombella apis]MBE1723690.1 nucleotidyltransferase domain-containing protein [Bombella apis]MBR9731315.1 nucleotidyltransferase domain-containing protein [Bombella apis]